MKEIVVTVSVVITIATIGQWLNKKAPFAYDICLAAVGFFLLIVGILCAVWEKGK